VGRYTRDPGLDPRQIRDGIWRIDPATEFFCDPGYDGCGRLHPVREHRACREAIPDAPHLEPEAEAEP
jgi:hypothetical protein